MQSSTVLTHTQKKNYRTKYEPTNILSKCDHHYVNIS